MLTEHTEPLLKDNKDRFVIFPVKHNDIWDFYKKIKSSFWTAEEIDLHQDIKDWNNKLSENERHSLKHILAFLIASDKLIQKYLTENFLNEVQYPEAKFFYGFQLMMKNIHSETHSLLIDTYVKDDREKDKLFRATETFPTICKKVEWASNWSKSDSFAERLIAFAAVEQIFFSGAFCSIICLQKRELMPGLTFSNELISRDEALNCDFAVHLHNHHLQNKVPKQRIRGIILEAVKIEREFIAESLPVGLVGINSKQLIQYMEFVTDRLLIKMECEQEFGSANPFDFMNRTGFQEKSNILEKRVGEFQKTVAQNKEKDTSKINIGADLK